MRILVDIAELEDLARVYEAGTTELAGITLNLRSRLSPDLLGQVAAYGFATRGVAYEYEYVCDDLTAHVRELEQFTLDLERVWAEASGLAQDGQLTPGAARAAPKLWWFRSGASTPGMTDSHAFAAADATTAAAGAAAAHGAHAASPLASAGGVGAVLTGGGAGGVHLPPATPGTWEELDRYLMSRGVSINRPPEDWQTTAGVHSPTSYHYRTQARDYSYGMGCDEQAIVSALTPHIGTGILELFHAATGTWYPTNVGGHQDHVHAAIAPGYVFVS